MPLSAYPGQGLGVSFAFGGCWGYVPPNALGNAVFVVAVVDLNPMFRWRAGNLAARQISGGFIKSFVDLQDSIRPLPVESPPPFDSDEMLLTMFPASLDQLTTVWQ